MKSNLCQKCFEKTAKPSECQHAFCLTCYISEYSKKIVNYLELLKNDEITPSNSPDLSIHCLECSLRNPIPGELIVSELLNTGFNHELLNKESLIKQLDNIPYKPFK